MQTSQKTYPACCWQDGNIRYRHLRGTGEPWVVRCTVCKQRWGVSGNRIVELG